MAAYKPLLDVQKHGTSPDTPVSYYYDEDLHPPAPELHEVSEKLRRVGSLGEAAGRVANALAQEANERRNMIGGVDNFWLQLSDLTDFNPVSSRTIGVACYRTYALALTSLQACTSVFVMRDHVTVEMMAEVTSTTYSVV